jgi:hypothetical protein
MQQPGPAEGQPPLRSAAAAPQWQQQADLRRIRAAVEAVAEASHSGPTVFHGHGGPSQKPGVSETGADTLLAVIGEVEKLTGAAAAFGNAAVITYGKWLFPGLRGPEDIDWETFETDATGSIRKEGRKSTVNTCALHPLEMVNKYSQLK